MPAPLTTNTPAPLTTNTPSLLAVDMPSPRAATQLRREVSVEIASEEPAFSVGALVEGFRRAFPRIRIIAVFQEAAVDRSRNTRLAKLAAEGKSRGIAEMNMW